MSGLSDVAKSVGIKPEVVTEVFEEILARVKRGDNVRIKGFGTFRAKVYPGRTLTSPTVNDGEPIVFGDSTVLKFKQSQIAKQRLNAPAKAEAKGKKSEAKANGEAKDGEAKAKKAKPGSGKVPGAKVAKPSKPKPAPEPEVDDDEGDDE